jgi:hypothetical protein
MAVDQRDPAGELADLGQKLSRPLIDDGRDTAKPVALGDRDHAGQHDKHARTRLAGLEQGFAMLVMKHLAEPSHAVDLMLGQSRKGLLMARKRGSPRREWIDRRIVCSHFHYFPEAARNRLPHRLLSAGVI